MKPQSYSLFLLLLLVSFLSGCRPEQKTALAQTEATVEFTLQTGLANGKFVFTGIGGEIDGQINPDLPVKPGDVVKITLINGMAMAHDLSLPDFAANSPLLSSSGQSAELIFSVPQDYSGAYPYFCTLPGHRQAGQEGRLIVSPAE